jgi:RimJ/RimL family protein N-acetyltransferase
MIHTTRLSLVDKWTQVEQDELWENCFAGPENSGHMNRYTPYAITDQWQMDHFLGHSGKDYHVRLIKRKVEYDIIGFVVHGHFFPGHPNNIGFNIGLPYIRKGYAAEALGGLLSHLRENGLTETYAHCYNSNLASIKCMEACGFVSQGSTGRTYGGNQEIKLKIEF